MVRCKKCGKIYDYDRCNEICPNCGSYNKPGSREDEEQSVHTRYDRTGYSHRYVKDQDEADLERFRYRSSDNDDAKEIRRAESKKNAESVRKKITRMAHDAANNEAASESVEQRERSYTEHGTTSAQQRQAERAAAEARKRARYEESRRQAYSARHERKTSKRNNGAACGLIIVIIVVIVIVLSLINASIGIFSDDSDIYEEINKEIYELENNYDDDSYDENSGGHQAQDDDGGIFDSEDDDDTVWGSDDDAVSIDAMYVYTIDSPLDEIDWEEEYGIDASDEDIAELADYELGQNEYLLEALLFIDNYGAGSIDLYDNEYYFYTDDVEAELVHVFDINFNTLEEGSEYYVDALVKVTIAPADFVGSDEYDGTLYCDLMCYDEYDNEYETFTDCDFYIYR